MHLELILSLSLLLLLLLLSFSRPLWSIDHSSIADTTSDGEKDTLVETIQSRIFPSVVYSPADKFFVSPLFSLQFSLLTILIASWPVSPRSHQS